MYKEVYPRVYIYEDFLSSEELNALYNYVHIESDDIAWKAQTRDITLERAKVNFPNDEAAQLQQVNNILKSRRLMDSDKLVIPMDANPLFSSISLKLSMYGINSIHDRQTLGVAKKQVEHEYMDQHSDDIYNPSIRSAMNFYINDDYEGGELYLSLQNISIKPKANSLILIPGTADYLHGVKPVIGSMPRYNITMTSTEEPEYYLGLTPNWL
jgi:hypothetical protein